MEPAKIFRQLHAGEKKLLFLVALLSFAAAGSWIIFSGSGFVTYYHLQKRLNTVHAENIRLQEENNRLRQRIDRVKNDRVYLEKMARRDFHLLRKNEVVFEFE